MIKVLDKEVKDLRNMVEMIAIQNMGLLSGPVIRLDNQFKVVETPLNKRHFGTQSRRRKSNSDRVNRE